jgi:CRP/FNR family transcriptional regulator, cyclic AMP receptor protein
VRGNAHEHAPAPAVRPMLAPGAEVDDDRLIRVTRRLAEATLELPAGAWDPRSAPHAARDAFAAVLLDGLVLRELRLDGTATAQLHVAGDTLDPFVPRHGLLAGEEPVAWHVVEDGAVAFLGEQFLVAARRFPALTVALSRRQLAQTARAARHAAVAQLPRVERRVLALLRGLAEDRGRVSADGVTVELPVTHAVLGQLVGARRPTVTLALKTLADDGILLRRGTEWLLAHDRTAPGRADPAAVALAA